MATFNFPLNTPQMSPVNTLIQPQMSYATAPNQVGMWDQFSSSMGDAWGGLNQSMTDNNVSWFGGGDTAGILPMGLQAAGAVASGVLGFQQLGLAKDQFAMQQEAFQTNLANQTKLTNQAMIDRQRARAGANPAAYSNPDEQWQKQNLL